MVHRLSIAIFDLYLRCLTIRHYCLFRYAILQKKRAYVLASVVRRAFSDMQAIQSVDIKFVPKMGYTACTDYKIAWEAPVVFAIWDADRPLFGMAIEFQPGVLSIRQLQGVAGVHMREIAPDWTQRLVKACIRFARLTGIKTVRLYHADQRLSYYIPWYTEPVDDPERKRQELRRRLRAIYDGTGRKLGLRRMKNWSEWINPNRARIP